MRFQAKQLADEVGRKMKRDGLDKKQAAKAAGMPLATFWRIAKGLSPYASVEAAGAVCDWLGMDLGYFWRREDAS